MMRSTCVLLSLAFLVGIFKSAEGSSGSIYFTDHIKLNTLPDAKRLCVVLEWDAYCITNFTCRTTLKVATRTKSLVKAITRKDFIPATFNNKTHYQCVYEMLKENRSCCSEIVKGLTGQKAINFNLGSEDYIEFDIKICLNYSGICMSRKASYVAPWKNPCRVSKPCGANALNCVNKVPNEYNCSCSFDWEGKNCTSLKGVKSSVKDKCMPDEIKVLKTESNKEAHACIPLCQSRIDKCKSFVFTPDKEGSKTGSCKFYDVNSKEKKLVSCPGKFYFETEPNIPGASVGTFITGPAHRLFLLAMAAMFLLSL